jgi:hypothetical protein
MQAFTKVGLEALLTPDNCVVVLIDHQPFQLANVNCHEPTMVINNAIGLAMTAKAYGSAEAPPDLYSRGKCSCSTPARLRALRPHIGQRGVVDTENSPLACTCRRS